MTRRHYPVSELFHGAELALGYYAFACRSLGCLLDVLAAEREIQVMSSQRRSLAQMTTLNLAIPVQVC
jgi:hypothetical protein